MLARNLSSLSAGSNDSTRGKGMPISRGMRDSDPYANLKGVFLVAILGEVW